MKRMALFIATIVVVLSVISYIFDVKAVLFVSALIFITACAFILFKSKIKYGITAAAVLLSGAAFGVYLVCYDCLVINKAEQLIGKSGKVTCTVIEEPLYDNGMAELFVKTSDNLSDNSNLCGKIKLRIRVNNEHRLAAADVGDTFTADVEFSKINDRYKRTNYSKGIFVSAKCDDAEITGHKYTIYESATDLRRAVRNELNTGFSGDERALANGITLGDNSDMSRELYSCFKICGTNHVTAVSGLHIGVLCVAFLSVFELFMKRKRAVLLAIIPTVTVVAVTGFTASAIRAGIMCVIMLLGEAFLQRTDGLNSLGVSIMLMLIYNPFYVCDLGFALSCTATAGVIVFTKIYNENIGCKIKIKNKYVSDIIHAAGVIFTQSIGAVLFTLPIQIIEFGYVSVVAPLAGVAICAAVSYSLVIIVIGLVISFIPFVGVISGFIFALPTLLLRYIIIAVTFLAKLPFSYLPLGTNAALLWLASSFAVIGLWFLLGSVGRKRVLALIITALLVVSLWSQRLLGKDVVEISSINCSKGFCTVIYSGEKCVIIGCGDDNSDAYIIFDELRLRGCTVVDAIVLPSESKSCTGGANKLIELLSYTQKPVLCDSGKVSENLENVDITAVKYDGGTYYEVLVYDKKVLVGFGNFVPLQNSYDAVFTGRVLPKTQSAGITVVSGGLLPDSSINELDEVYFSTSGTVSLKFKEGKGISVYAKQE